MRKTFVSMIAGLSLACAANAQVLVSADIATSTTWTANNVYNLQTADLRAARRDPDDRGRHGHREHDRTSAAASRCAAARRSSRNGTQANPIIMTSTADDGDLDRRQPRRPARGARPPTSGATSRSWARAYISENAVGATGNAAFPNASNVGDDGRPGRGRPRRHRRPLRRRQRRRRQRHDQLPVAALRRQGASRSNNELNGLSLGGIGRDTDIHHVEIMNNVDDGIEIWGGTVNLKYFNIWNIGDDSFDVDQGWRGKAQFGLIVQGYSARRGARARASATTSSRPTAPRTPTGSRSRPRRSTTSP